jgi:diguanylate cyclase (GGDEF)-like protein
MEVCIRNRKDEIGQMVEAIAAFQRAMARQNKLLEDRQDELRAQNLRFDAAVNHMAQGLAMFDAEQRLVVCNTLYARLYGLAAEQVRPGTTIRQLLEYRHAKGVFGNVDFEAFARDWLAEFSKASSRIQELADGRIISIVRRPMLDGGVVSTTEDITEQRRSEARIAHMAQHDALTGLPNRVLFNERLDQALARAKRGEMVATHMLDLDHFKQVNDTQGHPAGDKLLQMVADRLRTLVRETDTVARMGGDEFAVMQVAISHATDATSLALRIIEVLSQPYDIEGQQAVIGTSIGIAVGPGDGVSPDQILRSADLALYRAKGDGRGTFRFFEREMDAQMQARRSLERDLRKALANNEFELYYQPVVDLATNEISSLEALIRWRHPEKGMVRPDTFIPLAEEIGLIVPIGEWAIREACATAASWPEELKVAVNLSPAQFRNPGLLQVIVAALGNSGLPPDRLELEITETILLQDSEATLATLYRLRELGVRVAMDDFGTGYSSLSYLQSFPFDKIKIDRSFVKDIAASAGSLNIVRAVAALAKGLGMTATAEGVETKEQLDTIRSEGCSEMQGFLFSQPLPAADIERLFLSELRRRKAKVDTAAVA